MLFQKASFFAAVVFVALSGCTLQTSTNTAVPPVDRNYEKVSVLTGEQLQLQSAAENIHRIDRIDRSGAIVGLSLVGCVLLECEGIGAAQVAVTASLAASDARYDADGPATKLGGTYRPTQRAVYAMSNEAVATLKPLKTVNSALPSVLSQAEYDVPVWNARLAAGQSTSSALAGWYDRAVDDQRAMDHVLEYAVIRLGRYSDALAVFDAHGLRVGNLAETVDAHGKQIASLKQFRSQHAAILATSHPRIRRASSNKSNLRLVTMRQ